MEGTIGWGRGPVVNCPSTPMITVSLLMHGLGLGTADAEIHVPTTC